MTMTEVMRVREAAQIQISQIPEGSSERLQPELIIKLCDMVLMEKYRPQPIADS